jgi:twitching motility two-component system response regulator PilH
MIAKRRILIVDDDADLVLALRMVLEGAGYLIDEAANGKQGLEKMRQSRPDLVWMDVMMANPLDGYYTTQAISDDPELRDIPIVMATSIINTQYAEVFPTDQYLHIVEFLTKPVDMGAFLAKVEKWLEK